MPGQQFRADRPRKERRSSLSFGKGGAVSFLSKTACPYATHSHGAAAIEPQAAIT